MDAFRERKVDSGWIDDFDAFARRLWEDVTFKRLDGESLQEVQIRNLVVLRYLLDRHAGKNIVIGSHGTALCTVIRSFRPTFGYDDFQRIKTIMPWIVEFDFDDGQRCTGIETYDLHGEITACANAWSTGGNKSW